MKNVLNIEENTQAFNINVKKTLKNIKRKY